MDLDSNDVTVVCTVQFELAMAQGTPLQVAQALLDKCLRENPSPQDGGSGKEPPFNNHESTHYVKDGGSGKEPPFN